MCFNILFHRLNDQSFLLTGDFDFNSLTAVDRLTAQLLVGTFIALSGIVMINLFIALMSDTFQRVYDNAKANAVMQQASAILDVEQSLSKKNRDSFRMLIHRKCSPLVRVSLYIVMLRFVMFSRRAH